MLADFALNRTTRDGHQSWCKLCTLTQSRELYRQKRESAILASRAQYRANREALVRDEQRRRAARKAAGIKPYRSPASRARGAAGNRRWQQENAEAVRAYARAYNVRQPGRVRGYHHKRRALIHGNGGTYTNGQWVAVTERYDHLCLACRQPKPLTVDHVVPLSKGGSNDISNIQPLCRNCNSSKKERTIDYRLTWSTA